MKKVALLFIVLFAGVFLPLQAQNWQSLNNGIIIPSIDATCFYEDTVNDILYFGGEYKNVDGMIIPGIAAWDGSNWDSLAGGRLCHYFEPSGQLVTVYGIKKFKNELYVGGRFRYADTLEVFGITRWDGEKWKKLDKGLYDKSNEFYGSTTSFQEFNDTLYICGHFDSLVGSNIKCKEIIRWDGLNWQKMDTIPSYNGPGESLYIYDMEVYKNELYIGGLFGHGYGSDTTKDIVRWNGKNWLSVGGGIKGQSFIYTMEEYKGELYVGGYFTKQEGNAGNSIMKWNGTEWSEIGDLKWAWGNYNGQVHDLMVYNDELYVAGEFSYANGIPVKNIAKWDGIKWCGLGSIFDSRITSLGVYNDMLYAGGGFHTINGDSISGIAKWTGGSYVDSCSAGSGVEEMNEEKGIWIYPNPATDILYIKCNSEIINYEIYNNIGQLMKIGDYNNGIDLKKFPPNLYLLKIILADNIKVIKFIKE